MSEPSTDYEIDDQIAAVQGEYAEQIPGAIEAFRLAKEKAGVDGSTVGSETSGKRPTDEAALQAAIEAWTPSGVTADDLTALRDFMVGIVACRYWTWGAMHAGEVYGRALWGIPVVE